MTYTSSEEAAEKIRLILGDEELRNKMRLRALQRSTEFSVDRVREGLLKVVNSVTPREKKNGRIVESCRWVNEKKKEYGF